MTTPRKPVVEALDPFAVDCGDNSCVFAAKRGGMRTNGGCRCFEGMDRAQRRVLMWWAQRQRAAIAEAESRGAERERERVVAWLRRECDQCHTADLAALIEGGEHAKGSEGET